MERAMNEQKLKMLLKFERINTLEEFYNVRLYIDDYYSNATLSSRCL